MVIVLHLVVVTAGSPVIYCERPDALSCVATLGRHYN
jgi:hypothetical protein